MKRSSEIVQLGVDFEAGSEKAALRELKRAIGSRVIVAGLHLPSRGADYLPRGSKCEWLPTSILRRHHLKGPIRHMWRWDMDPASPTFDTEIHRYDVLCQDKETT